MLHLPHNNYMLGKGDPHFDKVVFLSGFNAPNAGTVFRDESKNRAAITTVGNAQGGTAQSVFGGSSLLLDGTGDYLTVPYSTDFNFDAEFTIEARIFATTVPTNKLIASFYGDASNKAWAFGWELGIFYFWFFNGAGTERDTSYSFSNATSTWFAMCADRDAAGKIRLYQDGVMKASATWTDATRVPPGAANTLGIGSIVVNGNYDWPGNLDELRITKGKARYASDAGYIPSNAPFPRW